MKISEDWLAVVIGLAAIMLAMFGVIGSRWMVF